MSAQRDWWTRVPRVLVRPREVFVALTNTDEHDLEVRQEPVLLIIGLAGIGGVLMSPTWGTVMNSYEVDWLIFAVVTFIAGAMYGAAAYFVVGGALYLGARGMGSEGSWRLARHLLAFSAVPLILSLAVTLPLQLIAFGESAFETGGADEGALGRVVFTLQLCFVAWSVALLALGVKTVYGWTWARAAGALALLTVLLAAFIALPSVL
jgi:hypothetical protein